ncbi:MAG: (2Fe-2S)-binding protein [Myxococcales bacterium]|nr:(2Fe-2S)-binding protein [Myxococcales bacterium]
MIRFEAMVNGEQLIAEIEPHEALTEVLRRCGLYGTKRGCESGDCGTCAVLVDGTLVASCTLLAVQANGHEITTIEGLARGREPSAVQQAYIDTGAVQCGFCTPGMVMATHALLSRNPDPTEADARQALAGHLCRCTGYIKPIDAVMAAAALVRAEKEAAGE